MSSKSFLIVGLGRYGRHIALKLNEMNVQVMAVDKRQEAVEEVLSYVTNAQIGDATNREFLSSLGIGNFDACIVAIGDDFLACLEVTSYLKELGAHKVIARAARDTQRKFLLRNGADDVVYPERDMGEWAAVRYSSDSIFDYMQLDDDYGVFEIAVPKDWVGHTIGQLDVRKHYKMNIVAVKLGEKMDMMTGANYVLTADQRLMVLARNTDITRFLDK